MTGADPGMTGSGAPTGGALLVTGPLGSGKTSVAVELGIRLEERGVANAVVDLDWLCWVGPGIAGERLTALLHDNLRSVVSRYRANGVDRFVLARTMRSAADVAAVRDALDGATLTVVRLEVSPEVAAGRVRLRGGDGAIAAAEIGIQTELWADSSVLDADLVVANDGRPLADTASEILAHLDGRPQAQWAIPGAE